MDGNDSLYDYSTFSPDRVKGIFEGWDGLGGYHGLLVKCCAELLVGTTVLDVGCGLCHLYEAVMNQWNKATYYCGVDIHPQVLQMARERYPDLDIYEKSVYDLSGLGAYHTVFAIGLYRNIPSRFDGIQQMLDHAEKCLVFTYFTEERGKTPEILEFTYPEYIDHDIDERLEIIRIWKH